MPRAGSELEQYLDAIGDLSFQLDLEGQVAYASPGTTRAVPAIAAGVHGSQFVALAEGAYKYASELEQTANATRNPKDRLHLVKELAVMATSLAPGVWVRVDEVRNDAM